MKRLFTQFSFPGGIPSHVAPETPGSIHEGGELGYALSHAYGAAFDNPDLIVACVVGDGEAETGPLATSWHSNKFLNPATDGAVLPILHLNGYKIANPLRPGPDQPRGAGQLFRGYGYTPYFVEGSDPRNDARADGGHAGHRLRGHPADQGGRAKRNSRTSALADDRAPHAQGLDLPEGDRRQAAPKTTGARTRCRWARCTTSPEHVHILEEWMKSYRPAELFDEDGRLRPELAELAPRGERRMSANPHANGGLLLRDLRLPGFSRLCHRRSDTGRRDGGVYPGDGRLPARRDEAEHGVAQFPAVQPRREQLEPLAGCARGHQPRLDGRNLSLGRPSRSRRAGHGMLSEHQCQGWLEGYLLTGRHGFFSCYEAFIHIIDSMFNQHAKWLKVCNHIPWRRPIGSLNYLLSSHVWRQDHNGFSHQDPGFIDHVVNKKAEVVRVYLPPDANCLLSVTDHCLRSRNYVNVVVAGKQPAPQWLTMDEAIKHCEAGLGIWEWASNDRGSEPDVVMACCGDVPTLETLAAVDLLRRHMPELKVRVINVVDLMKLQPPSEHPHGLSDNDFDALFTTDKPIIFAYHGYPWLIHRLTYRRNGHSNLHVRGYKEEGTTSTPFDMCVMNELDRFHLVGDVIDRVPKARRARRLRQAGDPRQADRPQAVHRPIWRRHARDTGWRWGQEAASAASSSTEADNV